MEETFRYLAIRDPQPVRTTKSLAHASVPLAAQSVFYKTITTALSAGRSRDELIQIATAYQLEQT